MDSQLDQNIDQLRQMTTAQLRLKYQELFGTDSGGRLLASVGFVFCLGMIFDGRKSGLYVIAATPANLYSCTRDQTERPWKQRIKQSNSQSPESSRK